MSNNHNIFIFLNNEYILPLGGAYHLESEYYYVHRSEQKMNEFGYINKHLESR